MHADRVDTRTSARPDSHGDPGSRTVNAAVVRQLRWQQREWAHILATHAPGTPDLVASADRAELNDALDVLREAGEDVPARLSRRGSLASVSQADLVADITRVLAW